MNDFHTWSRVPELLLFSTAPTRELELLSLTTVCGGHDDKTAPGHSSVTWKSSS